MRKLKTTLILFVISLLLFSGNCFAATSDTSSVVTNITKYIAIGIAVVVVILLLFLGYKMDSKENEPDNYMANRNKKKEKNNIEKEDPKYEADKVVYEPDNINTTDISEPLEYDENEESLFSTMNDEDSIENVSDDSDVNLDELEDMLNDTEDKPEEYGEDFDTSIIDSIDEEEPPTPKKDIEETMIFDSASVDNSSEDEVADKPEESIEEKNVEIDSIIEELNSLDDEDSPISLDNSKVKEEKEADKKENTDKKKTRKRYTKSKKVSSSADDFLTQIEENLKKSKKERDSKKSKNN